MLPLTSPYFPLAGDGENASVKPNIKILRIMVDDWRVPVAEKGTLLYCVPGFIDDEQHDYYKDVVDDDGNQLMPPWVAGQLWISDGEYWQLAVDYGWAAEAFDGDELYAGQSYDVVRRQQMIETIQSVDEMEQSFPMIVQSINEFDSMKASLPEAIEQAQDWAENKNSVEKKSDFALLEVDKEYETLVRNDDPDSVPVYIVSDDDFTLTMLLSFNNSASVSYTASSSTLDFSDTGNGDLSGSTIIGFAYNGEPLVQTAPMYKYALELFSQLYNADEKSMELQYHEDGLRVPTGGALIAGNSYYLPVHEGASISLQAYKAEKGYAANAQIELYVHVLGEGDVSFDNVVGSYGGSVPELTEGFHKIILTYFPNYGWCIGSTKMEALGNG